MYKIYYSGILEYGYVRLTLFGRNGKTTNKPATKFKFYCIAEFVCWWLNKTDKNFRTYKIHY